MAFGDQDCEPKQIVSSPNHNYDNNESEFLSCNKLDLQSLEHNGSHK